ncbi:MAG: hypothetical protein KQI78_02235 [Deltaproteobacteria bacterium]|nr:hypothetical protein [Deltaproteobacteria bacterium]
MAGLKSLNAKGLPEAFDLDQHGAKPIISLSMQDKTIRLSYVFPGFSFADHTGHDNAGARSARATYPHEVGMTGTGFLSESGKPLLPSFGRFLQIPPDHDCKVRVKKTLLRKRRNMKIKPAQENAKDQKAGTLEFNEATYTRDRFYPAKMAAARHVRRHVLQIIQQPPGDPEGTVGGLNGSGESIARRRFGHEHGHNQPRGHLVAEMRTVPFQGWYGRWGTDTGVVGVNETPDEGRALRHVDGQSLERRMHA